MLLSVAQLKELLEHPKNKEQITTAVAHERRLRLHAETTLTQGSNQAVTDFLGWVEDLIPKDKALVFKALFRYPVKSVSLTDKVFAALEKVFDGRNPVRQLDFLSPEAEQDAINYFEEIEFKDRWRFQSFERMRTAINTVLVCDLPQEQIGSRPEPYFYFLEIDKVVDFDIDDSKIQYIVFKPQPDQIAYFDSEVYQVFKLKDEYSNEIDKELVGFEHELGYCPAQFFWTTPVNHRQPSQKKSPLSNELSNLDWWLFHAISKQHLDMYASYPIYWGYAQDCDYEMNGMTCDNGFLKDDGGDYVLDRSRSGYHGLRRCPICSTSRLNGAGSYNEVPAPFGKEDADLRDPVGIISIDDKSLLYNVAEQDRLGYEIYTNVTGYGGEPNNDQAINERQVLASFEGRTDILKKLKKEFERAETWVVETICKLRYGGSFISASIDYGTEFYLYTQQELLEMYTSAKKEGLTDQILNMLQNQYYETKYRNNREQLQRITILTNLEPFRHSTKEQVRGLYESNFITFEEFYLKVNFANLIARFERENGSIIEFGSEIDFDKKIDSIKETLYQYGTENKPEERPAEAVAE